MAEEIKAGKKRAPTLYAIIAVKLLKGTLFVILAIVMYTLSDNNLPEEFQRLLHILRFNPERKFWSELATQIGHLTESRVLWAAVGTLIYSLFSLVEGVGLIFRVPWAGWLAIGESAFFIPIEIYELVARRFSHTVLAILGIWIEKGMGLVVPGFIPTPLGEMVEYSPSLNETLVCLGIWAFGLLCYTVFLRMSIPILQGRLCQANERVARAIAATA